MTGDLSTRNIVLTGFMGTGKSTVGPMLAERLGFRFVDTDEVIERRHGPIPEIFATYGEAGFREAEAVLAMELADDDGLVISTGGGMLMHPTNVRVLSSSGDIYCLTASVGTIVQRLRGDGAVTRPLLAGDDPAERVRSLLEERRERYAAFEQIDTDRWTPAEVVERIVELRATS